MVAFVRKNILIPNISFAAADGSNTQPTTGYVTLNYNDLSGAPHTVTLNLTYSATTNQWTTTWDSSVAGPCVVTWFAYGVGAAQAAAQGQFQIVANALNTV